MNNGDQTGIYTIDHNGVEIVAHTRCRRIVVRENYDSATGASQDLEYQAPVGAAYVTQLKGVPIPFTAPGPDGAYYPGQKVGKIRTLTPATSISAQQVENQEI